MFLNLAFCLMGKELWFPPFSSSSICIFTWTYFQQLIFHEFTDIRRMFLGSCPVKNGQMWLWFLLPTPVFYRSLLTTTKCFLFPIYFIVWLKSMELSWIFLFLSICHSCAFQMLLRTNSRSSSSPSNHFVPKIPTHTTLSPFFLSA